MVVVVDMFQIRLLFVDSIGGLALLTFTALAILCWMTCSRGVVGLRLTRG
jgi:hypothetical protein